MSKKKYDLPAMPIYWGDIFKAPDVCALPKDIRDTFFICLGRMWESEPRGYLMINKRKPTDYELASMLLMGSDIQQVNQHLNHLVEVSGVFSVNELGIVFSRRIVKDEENRLIKRNNGKKGGNPKLLGKPEVNQHDNLNPEDENESEDVIDTIKEVISDLNLKAGTSFKPTSKATKKHINARLNEGYVLQDFLDVNKKKIAKWKSDPKMVGFIRPETLYGTKFESYINEQAVKPQTEAEAMSVKHAGALAFARKKVE